MHRQALELSVDGVNIRWIVRHLGVNHQTVANWVKKYAEKLPKSPAPKEVQTADLDEMFSFIKKKANPHSDNCRQENTLFSWRQGSVGAYRTSLSKPD